MRGALTLRAAQAGFELVAGDLVPDERRSRAAFCLLARREPKLVVLAVRGTKTAEDGMADINLSLDALYPGAAGAAGLPVHRGFVELARGLLEREGLGAHLRRLHALGYPVVVCGHSLGGAVSTLLGALLRLHPVEEQRVPAVVYAYAPAACVSVELSRVCEPFVRSVVLGDDLVPRFSVSSATDLVGGAQRARGLPACRDLEERRRLKLASAASRSCLRCACTIATSVDSSGCACAAPDTLVPLINLVVRAAPDLGWHWRR